MSGRTRREGEPVGREAREDRASDTGGVGRVADAPHLGSGQNGENAEGHSGTRHSWAVSLGMVAAFLLGGAGMTFGPRDLLWVGVAGFVALGVYSLAAHTWTDHGPHR